MQIEHLNKETTDGTVRNLDALYQLFPSCFTEAKDAISGDMRRVVDWGKLRELLGEYVEDGEPEKYDFTWVGKRAAQREAAAPCRKTLRPCPEESVDWDTTQNLYIEGDNLEVLKLLQNSYMGKVKMIYIDPPYNTGNDFVYHDDFAQSADEYDEHNLDDEGTRYRKNTDSNGRFHSDWCSMIYTRLMVARSLLTDDGVIFISIDDNEQANLKVICDEVFGEDNFITTICVETSGGLFGLKAKFANTTIVKSKDYVLAYKKSNFDNFFSPLYIPSKKLFDTHFTFYKNDEMECSLNDFLQNNKEICYRAKSIGLRPSVDNLHQLMSIFSSVNDIIMNEINHIFRIREYTLKLSDNDLEQLRDGKKHLVGGNYVFLDENNSPLYLYPFSKVVHKADDYFGKKCSCVIQGDFWKGFNEDMGNIGKEGDVKYDNGKKPVRLIKNIAKFVNDKECIIIDFFSGSATSAHSIMQLNMEDGGHRKFIMVQLPENLDDSLQKATGEEQTAIKQSIRFLDSIKRPHYLSEIGKERIRRAGKKILEEQKAKQGDLFSGDQENLDIGFRVLKCDESNYKPVAFAPKDYTQESLDMFLDNIKEERTGLDLLFDCMMRWGLELSLPYETQKVDGCTIYNVDDGNLVACFDGVVISAVIDAIAETHPLRVVFRDSSFTEAAQKMNLFELFKQKCGWTDQEVQNNVRVI